MLDDAKGDGLEQARARKSLAKFLLDVCIATWNRGGAAALDEVNLIDDDDLDWEWRHVACPECRLCGRTTFLYRAPGHVEEWADFCLECWELDILDQEGAVVAHATRQIEKRARSLPPGGRIRAIIIDGKRIDLDPPIDPPRGGPN